MLIYICRKIKMIRKKKNQLNNSVNLHKREGKKKFL